MGHFDWADAELVAACRRGNIEETKLALAAGAKTRQSALDAACERGHVPAAQHMIASGASDLNRALRFAAACGQRNTVATMIQAGATDIDRALRAAIEGGHRDTVDYLIATPGALAWPVAVKLAARSGRAEIADLLIHEAKTAGATLSQAELNSALRAACKNNHEDAARLLVARGAVDIFSSGKLGRRPVARRRVAVAKGCVWITNAGGYILFVIAVVVVFMGILGWLNMRLNTATYCASPMGRLIMNMTGGQP